MAHAVFVQRLIVGIAPLALLFLVALGVLVLIAGFALLAKAVRRLREADAQADAILAEPAIRDTTPGSNLAWQDECELLFSMDARHPGLDRLRTAIRNEQQKGESRDA